MNIISNCVGPLSKDYLSKLPHHVTPCTNLHRILPSTEGSAGIEGLLNKSFPYSSSVPVPLIPLTESTRSALNGLDPTISLIREKMKWQMKKDKIISTVRKDKKHISEKKIKKAKKASAGRQVEVPRGVAVLAQHLDRDPDPHFSGVHNWYYTGGTLATLSLDEDYYLLHGAQSQLNYSKVVGGKQANTSRVDLENDDPIFQITSNSKGAAVRQTSRVSVFSTVESEDGEFQLAKVHTISDDNQRFLNVALKENSIRKYSTVSNNGVIKLWDTEYSKQYMANYDVEPGDGVIVTDCWSCLQYMDKYTLLWVNRCCLHIFDTRADLRERQLAWCPRKLTEMCEQLTYVVPSSLRDQFVYPVTTHQALTLDLRFGFCQRWTHMMASPPHFGFAQSMGQNREVICLGSQNPLDCVALVNEWSGEVPRSQFKPSSLPPPARGLHLARQQGLCLDPTLTQRCTQSMTGLSHLPSNEGLQVVRQSATADVFIQQLTSSEADSMQLTVRDLEAFTEWSEPTRSVQRDATSLTVSQVVDFVPVFKALTSIPSIPVKSAVENRTKNVARWQISKKYLEDCVDMLASKMLAVWEVEDEDEWGTNEEIDTLVEQDPEEKVLNWLDASSHADDRNITDTTPVKPTVTSTPFPLETTHQVTSPTRSLDQQSWMFDLTQMTPRDGHEPTHLSPDSVEQQRKRQKLCYDSIVSTPVKQPTSAKKPQSSAKKKFVPGF
uniref:Uncharacterized protein n=1 Tax=Homalodisca liturata TaxID=320908 RepID=A0A1B6JPS3_9HEMI